MGLKSSNTLIIEELQAEVLSHLNDNINLQAEIILTTQKLSKSFLTGYILAGGQREHAFKAWLNYAAEEGILL